MALHPQFPTSPYAPLVPEQRWFPADETLRSTAYEKLLPPLVARVREEVFAWRKGDYAGASPTSRALLQKDRRLAIQIDMTATPRHDNGAIFVQTISDYPLVEAIHQNVVKHPVLPDAPSRAKLQEHKSAIFTEKYADYLALGIEEWKKSCAEHEPLGKKAVLFVMTDDTRNCDDVGAYLEKICSELQGAVLVIHTKNNGEISEAAFGKNEEELKKLRDAANSIDTPASPYKAIVSVMMLKEGWDVRSVTTIVGLRPYTLQSNILPEQTLGRGLRPILGIEGRQTVSVMGTPAFMEFVESIETEGVTLDRVPMGGGGARQESLIVEVDAQNPDKNIEALDIPLPKLTRRYQRDYKDLDALAPRSFRKYGSTPEFVGQQLNFTTEARRHGGNQTRLCQIRH